MSPRKNRYALAVERAQKMYHERIKDELGDDIGGQWIVIDVNSGEYEVHKDGYIALEALKERLTDVDHVFARDGEFLQGDLYGLVQVLWSNIPQEEVDAMPHDGSLNLDHYLYGLPKRERPEWEE